MTEMSPDGNGHTEMSRDRNDPDQEVLFCQVYLYYNALY